MKERTKCNICKEGIVKGKLTKWKDGKYYCAKCQVDLNNEEYFLDILKKRQKELVEQLLDIQLDIIRYELIKDSIEENSSNVRVKNDE